MVFFTEIDKQTFISLFGSARSTVSTTAVTTTVTTASATVATSTTVTAVTTSCRLLYFGCIGRVSEETSELTAYDFLDKVFLFHTVEAAVYFGQELSNLFLVD